MNTSLIKKTSIFTRLFVVVCLLVAMGLVAKPTQAQADVSAPPWWNGKVCDTNNYPGSYALGASYNGVIVCGPGTTQGGTDHLVRFFPGAWGEYEWECVELVMRYMYLVHGISPYSANGKDVVDNYPGTKLTKVTNNGTSLPSPGDILSYAASPDTDPTYGHTAVVTGVSVNASGNGTVTVMQQNASSDGWGSIPVSAKKLGKHVSKWLHDPTSNVTVSPVVASLVTSDGVRHVYSGTTSGGLYETWWSATAGPVTWQLTNLGSAVTSISAQATPDGNQHVYYGTHGGTVGEVWWGPSSGGVQMGQSFNMGAPVTSVSSQLTSDGIQHIYSSNASGSLYETWWGQSSAVTWQVMNVGINITSISAIATPDGYQHIFYGATNGQVGEVWWGPGSNGGHLGYGSNVGVNITSVTSQITPDGVRHIYGAAADGGLYETWWGSSSTGATTWQIANVGHHPTSISSQVTADCNQHIYYGTSFGKAGEVWWGPSSGGVRLGQTYSDPAGVADSSVSSLLTSDGSQNLFFGNAAGSLFAMSWGASPSVTALIGNVS